VNRERKQLLQEFLDEHQRLTTRLAQLDAAITLIRGDAVVVPVPRPAPRAKRTIRRLKKERRKYARRVLPLRRPVLATQDLPEDAGAAEARRVVVLGLVRKSGQAGLTLGQLRKVTPAMKVHERGNALQQLKKDGKIRRVGTSWIAQAPFDA
jgi:hypothetical protein